MGFKEDIKEDVKNVFINPEEFGELHQVNGHELLLVMDSNEMIEREKREKGGYRDGVYREQVLFFVAAEDFGPLPGTGKGLMLDGKQYLVTDAVSEDGIYSISLEKKA